MHSKLSMTVFVIQMVQHICDIFTEKDDRLKICIVHCNGSVRACLLVAPLLLYLLINWEIPPEAGTFMHSDRALTIKNIQRSSVVQVGYLEEVKGSWITEESSLSSVH